MPGPINRPPVSALTSVPTSREAESRGSDQPTATEGSTAAAVRSADVLAKTRRSTGLTAQSRPGHCRPCTRTRVRTNPSSSRTSCTQDSFKMKRWRESSLKSPRILVVGSVFARVPKPISIWPSKMAKSITNTKFEIRDEEGKDYSLDGPLWLDPEAVYIDSDGQLRAKMPCWIKISPRPRPRYRWSSDRPWRIQRVTQKDVAFGCRASRLEGQPRRVRQARR